MAVGFHPSRESGASPRAELACRQLIQLIHERRLQPGDSLPPQQNLRRTLRASNDTLNAAMRRLSDAGIIIRRDRVGTHVADLSNTRRIGWRVGVASFAAPVHGPGSFYADLLHRVLSVLDQSGCESLTYFRVDQSRCHWPHTVADFPRLDEDIRNGRLDALLMLTTLDLKDWNLLRRRGLAVMHVGDWDGMPCAVLINRHQAVSQAAERLIGEGCRRVMLLDVMPEARARSRQVVALEEAMSRHGLDLRFMETLSRRPDLAAGHDVAASLLARPAGERPDAIIAVDDYMGMGLADGLAKSPDYRPRLAILTTHQLPLHFAVPTISYAIDTQGMAETGVRLLLDRLIDPSLPDQHVWIAPLPENGSVPATAAAFVGLTADRKEA